MKTIKFRGKCLDIGEWVYGYVIKYLTGKCSMYERNIFCVRKTRMNMMSFQKP